MVTSEPAYGHLSSGCFEGLCRIVDRWPERELDLPKIDVVIVEDDESVREATKHLLRLLGYATVSYGKRSAYFAYFGSLTIRDQDDVSILDAARAVGASDADSST